MRIKMLAALTFTLFSLSAAAAPLADADGPTRRHHHHHRHAATAPLRMVLFKHCIAPEDGRLWVGYTMKRGNQFLLDEGWVQDVEVLDYSGRSVNPRTGDPAWVELPSHSGGEAYRFLNTSDYAGSHFNWVRAIYRDGKVTVYSKPYWVGECAPA